MFSASRAAAPLSTWRALLAKMCLTSRQLKPGLASSIRAITPETTGAAEEVPLKVEVYSQFLTSTLLHLNALILFVINLKLHTTAFYF